MRRPKIAFALAREARGTGRPTDGRESRWDFLPSANRPIEIRYPDLVRARNETEPVLRCKEGSVT